MSATPSSTKSIARTFIPPLLSVAPSPVRAASLPPAAAPGGPRTAPRRRPRGSNEGAAPTPTVGVSVALEHRDGPSRAWHRPSPRSWRDATFLHSILRAGPRERGAGDAGIRPEASDRGAPIVSRTPQDRPTQR